MEGVERKAPGGGGGTVVKKRRSTADTAHSEGGGDLSYDPMHFIRSHSKNNDPADIQVRSITSNHSFWSYFRIDVFCVFSDPDLGSRV